MEEAFGFLKEVQVGHNITIDGAMPKDVDNMPLRLRVIQRHTGSAVE
jgi:hypothetical protein